MHMEVLDSPFRVRLVGKGGAVVGERFGETGLALMNELWATVRARKIATLGINHWVYLPDHRMFTGVEMADPQADPGDLETLEVEVPRYLRHVHVGPYSDLPRAWATLKAWIAAHGERIGSPGLEVYGHHTDDPAKAETTILIALEPKAS